jgi:mono/diheme cytochrome c family protein
MDELLKKVAEMRGMPASLVERSAKARAEQTGTTVEAVLAEWAGEETPADDAPAAAEPEPAAASTASDAVDAEPDEPADLTTDSLVSLASEAKRMPPRLILSSAQARADNSNMSLEEVLATWAGIDLEEAKAAAAATSPPAKAEEPPPSDPEPETPKAPPAAPVVAAAAVAGALSMDDLLAKVAEVKGMPAALAKRSAEARAKKTGEPLEAVLADWAGVDVTDVAATGTAADTQPEPADAQTVEEPASDTPTSDDIEVLEAAEPDVEAQDDAGGDAPVRRGKYPAWLAAAFVVIPLLAVAYILVVPNGPDCGTAGQLEVDAATGLAVNCDGSEYGSSTADYFAAGAAIYAQCAACHSADGSGGVGPAFTGGAVLATFPTGQCTDHIAWVGLGTANWPEPTYGVNNTPVGSIGVMPGFATSLTEQQLAEVSLYERVQFGGQPLEEAEVDCGLIEGDGEGEETVEASAP